MIPLLILALSFSAQSAPEPITVPPAVFAQAIQTMVGQTYEGGAAISRISAEGPILVVTFDGPAGWRARVSPARIADIFLAGFCEGRDFEYFVNGNLMRVDTS